MLKYYRQPLIKDPPDWMRISYEKALDILLGTYKDSDMTRDMLTIPNRIHCHFSEVIVIDFISDIEIIAPADGEYNLLPKGIAYDDDCNRIK